MHSKPSTTPLFILTYLTVHPFLVAPITLISTRSLKSKKTIQIITKKQFLAHTNPIFTELKILPLPNLITYSQLKLMHSIVYRYCPTSLHQIFQCNDQREISQNLRNEDEFTIPYPRIELFKKSLLYRLPTEWNALADLKFQHNRVMFEIGLKEYLLSLNHNE
jgi:hypothetical protein